MLRHAQKVVARLLAAGLARSEEIVGCTPEEVRALEIVHGVRLPAAYRAFLLTMGRDTGSFLSWRQGVGVSFDAVKFLTPWVHDHLIMLPARRAPKFPDKAFFFGSEQSVWFWYFIADGFDNDPPVWCWDADGGKVVRVADSFSAWLDRSLEYELRSARADAAEVDIPPPAAEGSAPVEVELPPLLDLDAPDELPF